MKEKDNRNSYLNPNEVGQLLMVSPVTVRQWARKGELKALTTPGGHRRFLRTEVERFARQRGMTLPESPDAELKILIVDDDVDFRGCLVERLDGLDGVTIQVAGDGFEAGLQVMDFRPQVVLLDLRMPGMDGVEVCRRLKTDRATAAVRVIAMTGYATPENMQRMENAGAETCLAKPFDHRQLLAILGLEESRASA